MSEDRLPTEALERAVAAYHQRPRLIERNTARLAGCPLERALASGRWNCRIHRDREFYPHLKCYRGDQ